MDVTTKSTKLLTNNEFYLGLCLAVCSSFFIGTSFIIKKISLQNLGRNGNVRAGAGGFGYLKDWLWWSGLLAMGIGESANFAAYAFAPASLVTPLGALSILVSALLADKILGESLKPLGKLGCFLCILGSTIMVIFAPKEEQAETLTEFFIRIQDTAFIQYLLIVCLIFVVVVFFAGPKYGNQYVSVYITLCSAIGSVTVITCKGLGLALKTHFIGTLKTLHLNIRCVVKNLPELEVFLEQFAGGLDCIVLTETRQINADFVVLREYEVVYSEESFNQNDGVLFEIIKIKVSEPIILREDDSSDKDDDFDDSI